MPSHIRRNRPPGMSERPAQGRRGPQGRGQQGDVNTSWGNASALKDLGLSQQSSNQQTASESPTVAQATPTSTGLGLDQDTGRGRYAVYTTGKTAAGIRSPELPRDGSWTTRDWLEHHSDRSNSSAAQRIRNGDNQDLDAYDFTFEKVDAQGQGIAGTAQGLPLITPWDSKVLDIQPTFQGSGGYGKFIALEDVETGMRFELHHLDSVGEFSIGQIIPGGTTIGTQGASGSERYDFATHVDIVGTPESVEDFVRSNQTGKFRTQEKKEGA